MDYDVIIIGSGPGGYVAAIRASQLGFKTAVVERTELGGICLNWGCIPTKSLLKSAQVYEYAKHAENFGIEITDVKPNFNKIIERSRKVSAQMNKGVEYLFKKNKITLIQGFGKLAGNKTIEVTNNNEKTENYTATHIILATGSRSRELPNLKQDGKYIIGYREALTLNKQPESMIVVGSGAIGTELAYFYNAIGTQVTLVEYMPNIVPLEDKDVSAQLGRSLKKAKIKVMVKSSVDKVEIKNGKCVATINSKGKEIQLESDIVLSAVGIIPNIENIGIEETGIELENGKIKVDNFYRTNIDGIYAIGDIVHGPALAHVASAEGITCVESIAGKNSEAVDYENIPGAVYTTPEVASVGLTEDDAAKKGYELKIGKFPFRASGKAASAGNQDGFIKLIFDAKTDLLLGAHMVGLNVTEMIAEIVVAKKLGVKAHDIIKSIHPHPTMSEAIMEAAAAAYDEAIHI
ncbi:MAG: dihydrolipoyl dehydrogenase [Bacteroidales bacterium]|nr:dihydrolipoyl dehydrogenase [Bacteroidales bacterium]